MSHSGPCVNAGDCCSWMCDTCEEVRRKRRIAALREEVREAESFLAWAMDQTKAHAILDVARQRLAEAERAT